MTDGEALLQVICDNPADDLVRLAYADWLEENQQPERAEFIRWGVQNPTNWYTCEGDGDVGLFCGDDCGLCQTCWQMQQSGCPSGLLGEGLVGRPRCTIRRGFICEIRCSWKDWKEHGAALVATHPVERVELVGRSVSGNGAGPCWRSRANFENSLDFEWWLPPDLFDLLTYDADLTVHPQTNRHYGSDSLALDALSEACLKYAHKKLAEIRKAREATV